MPACLPPPRTLVVSLSISEGFALTMLRGRCAPVKRALVKNNKPLNRFYFGNCKRPVHVMAVTGERILRFEFACNRLAILCFSILVYGKEEGLLDAQEPFP